MRGWVVGSARDVAQASIYSSRGRRKRQDEDRFGIKLSRSRFTHIQRERERQWHNRNGVELTCEPDGVELSRGVDQGGFH